MQSLWFAKTGPGSKTSPILEEEITSKIIAMAEGSFFEGGITMAGDGGKAGVVRYEEKRSSTAAPKESEKPPVKR